MFPTFALPASSVKPVPSEAEASHTLSFCISIQPLLNPFRVLVILFLYYSHLIPSGFRIFISALPHYHIYQSYPFPINLINPPKSRFRQLMLALIHTNRLRLRNKISSVFTIIIWPAVYFRNFTFPVTMSRVDRSCPL